MRQNKCIESYQNLASTQVQTGTTSTTIKTSAADDFMAITSLTLSATTAASVTLLGVIGQQPVFELKAAGQATWEFPHPIMSNTGLFLLVSGTGTTWTITWWGQGA